MLFFLTLTLGQGVNKKWVMTMKIKEVEQKTKLSAKAIRLYEDKGLIRVDRDENDYRIYSEDNIKDLLKIKLYRKCRLSLLEIYDVFNHGKNIEDMMYEKISLLDKEKNEIDDKKELCLDVIKAKGDYSKLFEYIETIDSDDYKEFIEELNEEQPKSLAVQLFQTLMLLGPILWFFLYLDMGKTGNLIPVFIASLICMIILTLSWRKFIIDYKFNKETVFQGLLHTIRLIILMIVFIGIILAVFIGVTYLQYFIYMKDEVYIFAQSSVSIIFSFIMLACVFEVVLGLYGKYFHFQAYEGYIELFEWMKKHIPLCIGICLVSLYLSLSSVTTVSPDKIVHHSFINPMGTVYTYDEIEKVECGFYGNGFFFREKGDFYYKVTMNDGKTLKFNDTQTTEKYEEDTYSELVVFDNDIMKHDVEKISSEKNSEYALLDQIYVDRFIDIINNK